MSCVLVSYYTLAHCFTISIDRSVSICNYGVFLCRINDVMTPTFSVNILVGPD
jgi:hypothetical protein